jgi:hypothetical protein
MALKKVKRPVTPGEKAQNEAKEAAAKVAEQESIKAVENEAVDAVEATEEVVAETPAEETEVKEAPKATKAKSTTKAKATTAKKETAKKEKAETPKKETAKKPAKKVELKPVVDNEDAGEEVEGARATKKKVMRLTQAFLEETEGLTMSIENITKVVNAFESVLGDVTNTQSYKFMNGMIQVQQRNGQVFKSPKVDYHSYKAPRTVKTFTQDTENVDKFRGSYDAETKVFTADGKWNYDTKEFDPVDLEIVVGQEDSED